MASSMNYSDDKYYGIKFQKYKLADDENAKYMWYTPDKAAIFQFDGSRTNFYVNGNPIDLLMKELLSPMEIFTLIYIKQRIKMLSYFNQKLCR